VLEFLSEFAADRIDDVDLAALECRQPRRLVRDHLEDQTLDARGLAPILVEGFKHQLETGRERDELIGTGAHRRLLEPLVTDLLDILFWHDPAGSAGRRVKGQEIGPRCFQPEAQAARIEGLHGRHPILDQVMRRTAIALEREFDVLCRHQLAVVKHRLLAQHELVAEPILRRRKRLGQAWRQRIARHRLDHRVVQCIEHHEGRDDPLSIGGIEPGRRQRDVDAPGQLPLLVGGAGRSRGAGNQAEGGESENIATRRIGLADAGLSLER